MPTSPNYGFVTPAYGEVPDGPAFFQELANDIDAAIKAEETSRIAGDTTIMASRTHSSVISCTTSTNVIVPYNVEANADGIPWDTDHFTVPDTGYYTITALCHWATSATNLRAIKIYIDGVVGAICQNAGGASGGVSSMIVETMKLNAGQQVSIYIWQNSGATLATAGGAPYNRCSIIRVRS